MTASHDFQHAMQLGNLNSIGEAIKTALGEAIELEITTWVAMADHSEEKPSSAHNVDPSHVDPSHRMHTRINIVNGQIDNQIGSRFIRDKTYDELREFHLNQVKRGQAIIHQNLGALKELFGFLMDTTASDVNDDPMTTETEEFPSTVPFAQQPETPSPSGSTIISPPLVRISNSSSVLVEDGIAPTSGRLWGDSVDLGDIQPKQWMTENNQPLEDPSISSDALPQTSLTVDPEIIDFPAELFDDPKTFQENVTDSQFTSTSSLTFKPETLPMLEVGLSDNIQFSTLFGSDPPIKTDANPTDLATLNLPPVQAGSPMELNRNPGETIDDHHNSLNLDELNWDEIFFEPPQKT